MTKQFIISNEVLKVETLFILNCNSGEFIKRANKYGAELEEIEDLVCGAVVRAGKYFFRIVWVEKFTKKPEHIADLIHELLHLVVRICKDKGIPIKANIETGECGDEAAAYLLEFYTRECLKKL